MRVSLFALAGLCLSNNAYAALANVSAVNAFLQSVGISPGSVSSHAKTVGGITLTCAVLGVGDKSADRGTEFLTAADGTEYLTVAQAQWSATAWMYPECIYSPTDIDSLRLAVLVAQFTGTKFAVRSGGHSPLVDWANIDNYLLVSMSNITDQEYDPSTETIRSGMGNRWGDVYSYLLPYNRIVVGGRLNEVGLGLATGGGLSHFSNAHGWVSQNVVTYEVMLANGTHVNASESENPDLYFAAKTGTNNFGIVTHITQRTFPMGRVWGGLIEYAGNASTQFLAAMADYQASGQLDKKSAILPYVGLNNDTILATFVYFGDVDRPAAFQPFYDISAAGDYTQIYDSLYNITNLSVPFVVPRWTYAATTLYLDKIAYKGVVNIIAKYAKQSAKIIGGSMTPMFQPISKSMVEASASLGATPMNLEPRAQLWVGINIGWTLAEDDEAIYKILTNCLEEVESYTKAQGVHSPFIFLNDAFSTQRPYPTFGGDTLEKLQAASKAYDPEGVFQKLVPGGFKVSTE
ncbi:oxidase/Diels-Alderase [Xylariaceae sp. FL0804]|nr:oxidase/Diels-Alderase [Xylariaceae sp. FL0804]